MKLRSVYPIVLVPLLCVIIIGTVLLNVVSPFTHASPVPGCILLPSSIARYTGNSKLLAPAATKQSIPIAVGLNLRNQAGLTSYLKQITSPQSPLYHHYLSTATFTTLYAPLP